MYFLHVFGEYVCEWIRYVRCACARYAHTPPQLTVNELNEINFRFSNSVCMSHWQCGPHVCMNGHTNLNPLLMLTVGCLYEWPCKLLGSIMLTD